MKKIIAAAAGLMMVGVMASSASAVENKFGGYWRTRIFTNVDFTGNDTGTDLDRIDTRTRLYYTAIFNENFKFVNKFEFDAVWGEPNTRDTYGGVGADGVAVEIKNSYADFTMGAVNYKIGVQGVAVSRGLLIDTDAAAAIVTFNAGPVAIPVAWMKVSEDDIQGDDRDVFAVMPVFNAGEGVSLQPYLAYDKGPGDWDNYYAGINVDAKMDAASVWGTAIYNFGEMGTQDISAFLLAAGASAGPVHGQAFYATGDDNMMDGDIESFISAPGQSYYWAEIMGYGIFDARTSAGSPGDQISNVWAANVGFTVKPMDNFTLTADVWYAELAEAVGDTDLGLEFDVVATIGLMDNLKLDLVAAYLLAGDATGGGNEDPLEVGARLSLSF